MYAAFKKENKGDSTLYALRDKKICLFGRENGWIPWLLQMSIPETQDQPYRWHLNLQEALGLKEATEYYAKERYSGDVNAIVINLKPLSKELSLFELVHVWGYSADGWTPMLWHLRYLTPTGKTNCTPSHFDDFTISGAGDDVYEFLYAMGTVKNGKLFDSWAAPAPSSTNGTLLWSPEPLNYFMNCIKGQALAASR